MPLLGERLRAERERLGLGQQELAEMCGVTMRSQRNYEKGERQPDADYLAAFMAVGGNVLHVLAGSGGESNRALTPDLSVNTAPTVPTQIDVDRLARIVEMLEVFASNAGKRWPSGQLVAVAAEVYNVLVDEPALDKPKVERILKLVVNR